MECQLQVSALELAVDAVLIFAPPASDEPLRVEREPPTVCEEGNGLDREVRPEQRPDVDEAGGAAEGASR